MANHVSIQMNRLVWVITFVVATVFFFTGMTKVVGAEYQVAAFAGWGLPVWFMYLVGVYETAAALLLMAKPFAFWAALGLVVEMLGGIVVLLVAGQAFSILGPMVMIALLAIVVFSRMPPRIEHALGRPWQLGHTH